MISNDLDDKYYELEEAIQLNIEVKTKQEIESLLEMWH